MPRNSSLLVRIIEKVDRGENCWQWIAALDRNGYGFMNVNGRRRFAHRVMYELMVGDIPDGLVIDHLCGNPGCVRPAHLEPVTQRENVQRGRGGPRTHCPQGHELIGDVLYIDSKGWRHCYICMKANNARYRAEGRPATRCRPIAERTGKPRGVPPRTPGS